MTRALGLYSAGIEMASNPNEIPKPDTSSVIGFLRSCPTLAGLPGVSLEQLAGELHMVAHDPGKRFYADEVPTRTQPLRFIVHGQATWESSRARDQKAAWMLGPGSVLGLDVINDWAWHAQIGTPWPTHDLPTIRCRAQGKVWTLELAPERFAAAFEGKAGALLLAKLLRMYPTQVYAPDIVQSLRASPTFARTSTSDLHRLLEWAPTLTLWPQKQAEPIQAEPDDEKTFADQPIGHALYYVIEGELELAVDDEVLAVSAGQLEGPETFARKPEASMVAPQATQSKCTVVMVSAESVWAMIRRDRGFARSLGPLERSKRVI